jgi:large subunit ribosomal protein L17
MRHKFGHRKLNKTSEHRKALFQNMLNSLIKYEQITTTLPKAKELKPIVDKAITLGKKNNLQSKKNLFSKLQNKNSVDKLTKILSERYMKRNGGYSRVIRAGFRYGDDAPMAVIELIDRDIEAKKVDIKIKKVEKSKVSSTELKSTDVKKRN